MNKIAIKRNGEPGTPYSYFRSFQTAQTNLNKLIQEERLLRRLIKSRDRHG